MRAVMLRRSLLALLSTFLAPDRREGSERHRHLLLGVLEILQPAGLEVGVGLHIEVPVAAEVEEDGLADASSLQRSASRIAPATA